MGCACGHVLTSVSTIGCFTTVSGYGGSVRPTEPQALPCRAVYNVFGLTNVDLTERAASQFVRLTRRQAELSELDN